MARIPFVVLILILTFRGAMAWPAHHVVLSQKALDSAQGRIFELAEEWKYHPGDNPEWADPDLDDGSWERTSSLFSLADPPPGGWSGIGWFRIHLNVDSTLWQSPLSVMVKQLGACEIYLDGALIYRIGQVPGDADEPEVLVHTHNVPTVKPIEFDAKSDHVLAVRFSYHRPTGFDFGAGHPAGFSMALAEPWVADAAVRDYVRNETHHHLFVGAAAVTIALLHLLFFAFYPRLIGHLYYALFTMGAAAIAYVPLQNNLATDVDAQQVTFRVFHVALILTTVAGVRFLYAIFYDRMPRMFWLWLVLGILAMVLFWNGPIVNTYFFCLAMFAEILRVLVVAVIRRKPFAWLIAVGVATFILTGAFQMALELLQVGDLAPNVYLYGLFAMLIIMAIYLAGDFATINTERVRLEADNALKAKELEEAWKRQKVLDELAATNEELRQTQSQLVQSEKMASLGNLVAGVAHEINTPVGAINSMHNTLTKAVGRLRASLIEIDPRGLEGHTKIRKTFKVIDDANAVIESGTTRVADIVKRLRSFARLDEAHAKKADIHEGLDDTLGLIHHEIKRDITVHKNYGAIPSINCYPGQLNQVFLNILMNARQAIDGKGEITITTYEKDGNVHVEFKDTGKGIPKEDLDRVFDPGFTTKGVRVGTGLGLSICYQIMKAHKGEIRVDSEWGKGTTFTVIIPSDLDEASLR